MNNLSMEFQTESQEKVTIEKTLEASKDNTKLLFNFKIKGKNLLISTEIKNSIIPKIYEGIISQEEIQKNRYFLQFDTMAEILEEIIMKTEKEIPKVREEHDNLILEIFLFSAKFKQIEFILKPKSKSSEDKFKDLYDIVTELKKENSELKQEINNLKNEIVQFKEQIKILIDFKNRIEEEKKRIEEEEKLLKMDSKILGDSQEKKNKIKEFISPNQKVQSELKYRMTRDGSDFNTFHNLCDNIAPNLLLIKDNQNNIFGSFITVSWEKRDCQKADPQSFLFSLSNNKKYNLKDKEQKSIYCYQNYGPWFWNGDIGFCNNNMTECKSSGKGNYLDESLSTNKAGDYFKVQEVEFYRILIE